MTPGAAPSDSLLDAPGQMLGKPIKFSGKISGARNGETIEIQRLDAKGNWPIITTTTAAADGKFRASWLPLKAEKLQVRDVPTSATVRAAGTIPTKFISVSNSFNA